jgi:hypothetical protein
MWVLGVAKVFGGTASCVAEQFEAVADGADGAAAMAGDLRDGHTLNAIHAEDGKDAGRFGRGVEVEVVEKIPIDASSSVRQVIGR